MILERTFQAELIKDLKKIFPGCVVVKNDCNYIQGFPDLTILYNDKWAVLECKNKSNASKRPNQDYYVDILNKGNTAQLQSHRKNDIIKT